MARNATPEDVQIALDRLRGNGAWNGQGLLVHLALTSRKDSSRAWMVPLKDLCEKIADADDEGLAAGLDDDEAVQMDELAAYAAAFVAALPAD